MVKTNREHQAMRQIFFDSAFQLNHQAAVAIQKTGYIRQINFRWSSHGIVLVDLRSSSKLYRDYKD